MTVAKPFLKWAGGKTRLVSELLKWTPSDFTEYHEPFLGGGALFFALQPQLNRRTAFLSDMNDRLVRTYRGVRDHVENVIEILHNHYTPLHTKHGVDFYKHTRAESVDHYGDAGAAAHFIYLNRTCFNGLYRVNKSGKFNVPMGKYTRPLICDAANLRACSGALQGTEIAHHDFRTVINTPLRPLCRSFWYFDPPYVPLSDTAAFTAYTTDGFGQAEQEALRDTALWLKNNGAHVILSNSGSDVVEQLYTGTFEIRAVQMLRRINSKAAARGAVKEFLIR